MANSYQRATSDGTMTYLDISIDYLDRSEISVYFDDVLTTAWSWSGSSDKRVLFSPAVPNGVVVMVKRITDASELRHEFSKGAAFTAETLDEDLRQALHMAQEANEGNLVGDFFTDINMHGFRVYNVGTAVDDSDVLTLAQYKADADGANAAKDAAEDAQAAAAAAQAAAEAAAASAVGSAAAAVAAFAATLLSAVGATLVGWKNSLTGSVLRTVHARLSDDVNARDFGMSTAASGTVNSNALIAALAVSPIVYIPAGTYNMDPTIQIDIGDKTIYGARIFRTVLVLTGTNTTAKWLHNNGSTSTVWGNGKAIDVRNITFKGNWDGSTTRADNTFENINSLVRAYAPSSVRVEDCEFIQSYGTGYSAYRQGYANFTKNKVRVQAREGMWLEAPSGSDAITSTNITHNDFNSNRGVACIRIKNGVGVFITHNVFEDAKAGVYLDGTDNRAVSISHNHCETFIYDAAAFGLLRYVGSGLGVSVCFNFCDQNITRSSPSSQTIYAVGNQGMTNIVDGGQGPWDQDLEVGLGAASTTGRTVGFFGSANTDDVLGTLRWRSNNNNNAAVSAAAVRAVQKGNVNQNFGALEFGTSNNGLVYRWRMDQAGNTYPLADNTYTLGLAGTNKFLNVFSQNITLNLPASATPANNGEMTMQLTSNTSLTFRVKGSDGTVRQGSITLA